MSKTKNNVASSDYIEPSKRSNSPLQAGNSKTAKYFVKEDIDNRILMEFMKSDPDVVIADIVLKYFPNKTRNSATVYGWRLVNSPKARKRLGDKMSKRWNTDALSFQERQSWLSLLILDELDENPDVKDKIKAIQVLNDMDGIGKPNAMVQVNHINIEEQREIVRKNLFKMLDGIETDVKSE